jgi:hypothetical protein
MQVCIVRNSFSGMIAKAFTNSIKEHIFLILIN